MSEEDGPLPWLGRPVVRPSHARIYRVSVYLVCILTGTAYEEFQNVSRYSLHSLIV